MRTAEEKQLAKLESGRRTRKRYAEKRNRYSRAYYKANKGKFKVWARARNIENKGISLTQYDKMIVAQGNKCATCASESLIYHVARLSALVIDHNHTTGLVRGLLCNQCNLALGLVHDNIETLAAMIAYLGKYR